MKVTNTSITMPNKKTYKAGETTCNGKPAKVEVAFWKVGLKAAGQKPDKIYTSDFNKIRFLEDYEAFTLAFLPKGAKVSAPSTAPNLGELGAADGSGAVTSTSGAPSGATTPPSTTPTSAVTPTQPPSTTAPAKDATTGTTTATTKP